MYCNKSTKQTKNSQNIFYFELVLKRNYEGYCFLILFIVPLRVDKFILDKIGGASTYKNYEY